MTVNQVRGTKYTWGVVTFSTKQGPLAVSPSFRATGSKSGPMRAPDLRALGVDIRLEGLGRQV